MKAALRVRHDREVQPVLRAQAGDALGRAVEIERIRLRVFACVPTKFNDKESMQEEGDGSRAGRGGVGIKGERRGGGEGGVGWSAFLN